MTTASRRWITPEIWDAMTLSRDAIRALLLSPPADALREQLAAAEARAEKAERSLTLAREDHGAAVKIVHDALTAAHGELVAERQAVFDAIARGDSISTILADLMARSGNSSVGPTFTAALRGGA